MHLNLGNCLDYSEISAHNEQTTLSLSLSLSISSDKRSPFECLNVISLVRPLISLRIANIDEQCFSVRAAPIWISEFWNSSNLVASEVFQRSSKLAGDTGRTSGGRSCGERFFLSDSFQRGSKKFSGDHRNFRLETFESKFSNRAKRQSDLELPVNLEVFGFESLKVFEKFRKHSPPRLFAMSGYYKTEFVELGKISIFIETMQIWFEMSRSELKLVEKSRKSYGNCEAPSCPGRFPWWGWKVLEMVNYF